MASSGANIMRSPRGGRRPKRPPPRSRRTRPLDAAALDGERAARVEAAAGRRVERRWQVAGQAHARAAAAAPARGTAESSACV